MQVVFYCSADYTLFNGDTLRYGGMGEVTGPVPDRPDHVSVRFQGNTGSVGCHDTEISKLWPPPPLAGDYKVGDEVYFCGVDYGDDKAYAKYGDLGKVNGSAVPI